MTYGTAMRSAAQVGAWEDLPFFNDGSFARVAAALDTEKESIFPPPDRTFAALTLTQPDDVRAVILGQDPYPTAGHAHGLAFSCAEGLRPLPRSLGNIYKELHADLGIARSDGDLNGWAAQGVLLLNSALTVREGAAGSHSKLGWSTLVSQVLARIADGPPAAWLLWGKHAQALKPQAQGHLFIETAHPSPLSARRGFFDSKPFSRTNAFLESIGRDPIDWTA